MKAVFTFISVVLHPIFIVCWMMFLLYLIDPVISFYFNGQIGFRILVILGLLLIVMPIIASKMLIQYGLVKDLEMNAREERFPIYIFTVFSYAVCYRLLIKLEAPQQLLLPLLCSLTVLTLLLVLNRWIKVSAHLAALGGLIGVLVYYTLMYAGVLPYLMIAIILAGITASSRLFLQAHNNKQLLLGFSIGVLAAVGIMLGGKLLPMP